MRAIASFTLVIWCIGVESLPVPGVRQKRETKGCSSIVFPSPKRYQVFYKGALNDPRWQESREACKTLGGDLAEFSNRQEQDKILNAFRKFPIGRGEQYWIGITKKQDEAFWISGKKVELDSDLKFTRFSRLGFKSSRNQCGVIYHTGIRGAGCNRMTLNAAAGYVCEFPMTESIEQGVEFCNDDNNDNEDNGDDAQSQKGKGRFLRAISGARGNNNNEDNNNNNEDNNEDNNNNIANSKIQ